MKNLNIYIIHSTYLVDRLENINEIKATFNKLNNDYNISIEVVEDYNYKELNQEKIRNIVKLDPLEDSNYQKYNNFLRNLTPQSISKILKHYKCLQEIRKKNSDEINLIIEDDVSIEEQNLRESFNTIVSKLGENYDMCLLGLPASSNLVEKNTFKIIESKLVYNVIPGCDTYLISSQCANKILAEFIPIRFELNIQYNYLCEKNDIVIKQITPNIVVEGTKVGKYKSSTNVNNIPLYNFNYKDLNNLILKPNLDNNEKMKIDKLFEDEFLKDNPDFIYLKALYSFKNEKYEESLKLFNKVYSMYLKCELPLNKESNFLLNYTEIFKFTQTV